MHLICFNTLSLCEDVCLELCPFLVFFCCRSAPGSATVDGKAVCVCSAQSSDGQSVMEASRPAGYMPTGLGFVFEGSVSATTGMR